MTRLTDKIYAVEVPEDAKGFETDNPLSVGDLVYYMGLPSVFNFRKISLPPGTYRFLFTTKAATEEEARKVVGSSEWFFPEYHIRYIDYAHPYDTENKQAWDRGYKDATSSLHSLLRSKSLDPNKNYALIEKQSSDGTE